MAVAVSADITRLMPGMSDARAGLEDAELPVDDLTVELLAGFVGAYSNDTLLALGGIEYRSAHGLLRSFATRPAQRRKGLAARLLAELETRARKRGVDELFLLTESATAFFAAHGFETVDRSSAPAPIAATEQFSRLCPASAVCMRKALGSK